jgi:hypothetical protein
MSDPVNTANERVLLAGQQPSTSGFDVNAAAAEVRAGLAPEPPHGPQRWTAADYGWDPTDANAVAWAAYYSELGVDPLALAAQQAAEAAAQSTSAATAAADPAPAPAPAVEPPLELGAAPGPGRGEPELGELAFAPATEAGGGAAPAGATPDDFDGGSAIWELLSGEPPRDDAPPAPEEEFQHGAPGGWAADGARLDDFQLASGGSFDESTAPHGDLTAGDPGWPGDAPGDGLASDPQQLPPLELGVASATQATPPKPDLSIDLGFVEDELTAAASPAAAEPVDAGWAAFAVPAGDPAVDLATFDADPQLDLDRPAAEGTAMWGLPAKVPPTPAAAAAPPAAVPAELAPLSAELGEPLDGSLILEPILDPAEDAAAAPPSGGDPWDAPVSKAAPLDLAPAEAAPVGPAAETILEVGEEVVEIAALPPDGAVPPLATPLEQPGVEHLAAPPEPEPEPEPEPVEAPPSSFVAGEHRVVVHTADGQVKRGSLCDVALDGPELLLQPQSGGAPEALPAERVKAIFFMMGAGDSPPATEGKKVRVTFRDGRQVAGFSPDYAPERVGFFMVPVDTRTHTARIWVYRASVRQVAIS